MTEESNPTIADLLGLLNTEELAEVNEERAELLAARGLAEMLAQQGQRSLDLLRHGRYQDSLSTPTPNAGQLIADNTARLREACDALDYQVGQLEALLEEEFYGAVELIKSHGSLVLLIADELEDHQRRLGELKKLVAEWRKELPG